MNLVQLAHFVGYVIKFMLFLSLSPVLVHELKRDTQVGVRVRVTPEVPKP